MKCKLCGADMVVRTARRGNNIGSKFWGCSRFPNCRNTENISISELNNQSINVNINESNNNNLELPRGFNPKPLSNFYQCQTYQTLGTDPQIVKYIGSNDIELSPYLQESKWRLDIPVVAPHNVENDVKTIVSIALKILNRGRVISNSEYVTNSLSELFNYNDELDFDPTTLSETYIDSNSTIADFDGSDYERKFYEQIFPSYLGGYGSHFKSFIIPQVTFEDLIKEEFIDDLSKPLLSQRVDFLICFNGKNIIVELDGQEHRSHIDRDKYRDLLLKRSGFIVIRIPNDEIYLGSGVNLSKLQMILEKEFNATYVNNTLKYFVAHKLIHQLQISCLVALRNGLVDFNQKIVIDINTNTLNRSELNHVLSIANEDLKLLINKLLDLYDVSDVRYNCSLGLESLNEKNSFIISFDDSNTLKQNHLYIKDIHTHANIQYNIAEAFSLYPKNLDDDLLRFFLKYLFGFDDFREGQLAAVKRTLQNKDSIVLLPTGAGKSVIFQLSAFLLPGICIVVSPIISLMDDQIDNLNRKGIDRAGTISSSDTSIEKNKKLDLFELGEYFLLYVSPERFQIREFREALKQICEKNVIPVVAIDEAHCVSEWGHDFRTSYLNLANNARQFCCNNYYTPSLLALTGTASQSVLKDVQRELDIIDNDALITPESFDRKNLHFSVVSCNSDTKQNLLLQALSDEIPSFFVKTKSEFYNGDHSNCGIVFCPHTNGDFGVTKVSADIENANVGEVNVYSGKIPKTYGMLTEEKWNVHKKSIATRFKNNSFPILVATKAFGMGIDKPNIRFTVHYGIPSSLESFYQEAGRAGRDGKSSECILIFSNDFKEINSKLLDVNTPLEEISNYIKLLSKNQNDDISRMLYFHVNSFAGFKVECENVFNILDSFKNFNSDTIEIYLQQTNPQISLTATEKALQRLIILGIVKDYSLAYANNEFTLRLSTISKDSVMSNFANYVASYSMKRVQGEMERLKKYYNLPLFDFVKESVKALITFVYDTIEKGRRRGIQEMLALCEDANETATEKKNWFIHNRIARYFGSTFNIELEDTINSDDYGMQHINDLTQEYLYESDSISFATKRNLEDLKGETARYLESYPDHPGLLMMRALSELFGDDYNIDTISSNAKASLHFLKERYMAPEKTTTKMEATFLLNVYLLNTNAYERVLDQVKDEINMDAVYEELLDIHNAPDDLLSLHGYYYYNNLGTKICQLLKGVK